MIKFQTPRIANEWNSGSLNPTLRTITIEAARSAKMKYNWDFELNSIYRTPQEDAAAGARGNIHPAWRSVDVRTKLPDGKMQRPQSQIADVTRYINLNWMYDPSRPKMVVCYSETHGSGPHLHLQAHPNTKKMVYAKNRVPA